MQKTGKEKDWVLFPYDPNHEMSVKIDFSGNIKLANGVKGTILASKGTSKDGNTKFVRLFKQVGVLFKGDEGKFTGDITDVEIGGKKVEINGKKVEIVGKKALVGWLNDKSDKPNISGYANEPGVKAPNKEEKLSF